MAQTTENPNATPAAEPATTGATPITTKAANVLESVQSPANNAEGAPEHKVAEKANRPKKNSFVAQLLDATETVSKGTGNPAIVLTFGLPNGSSKVFWTNPKMWANFDKFAIDSFVRVDVQETKAGVTTYLNVETGEELYHNTSNESFSAIGRATSSMFNAQSTANTDDLEIIMNAPDSKASAVADYLGRYRSALVLANGK